MENGWAQGQAGGKEASYKLLWNPRESWGWHDGEESMIQKMGRRWNGQGLEVAQMWGLRKVEKRRIAFRFWQIDGWWCHSSPAQSAEGSWLDQWVGSLPRFLSGWLSQGGLVALKPFIMRPPRGFLPLPPISLLFWPFADASIPMIRNI